MAQLRKYEVRKMDYFYAVVHCNNRKTASKIIKENQDLEFELTNIRLQLYIVEDSLQFPYEPKEEASEIPANYSFDQSKISRALNHSTVKLSWDQNDPKRASKLQSNYRNFLKKKDFELNVSDEEEAYRDLIASSSSEEGLSEDEEEGDDDGHGGRNESQKRIEEMRMKLLSGLEEDKPRKSAGFDNDGDEASEELDV